MMGNCDPWEPTDDRDEISFLKLTAGQPLAQRQAGEELAALLERAFLAKTKERGELSYCPDKSVTDLAKNIRYFAGVLNDSPVESYEITEVCGLSLKISTALRRVEESYDDEWRKVFDKMIKVAALDVLVMMKKFDGTPRD